MSNKNELKTGYLPVFEKDGIEFIIPQDQFVGEDERDATKIGIGSLLEAVAMGFRYTMNNIHNECGIDCKVGQLGPFGITVLPEGWREMLKTEEVAG